MRELMCARSEGARAQRAMAHHQVAMAPPIFQTSHHVWYQKP